MSDYLKNLRSLVGHMKVVLPGVRGLITDSRGWILLQQRGDFLNWGLPAGVVDEGESALEALKREVKEETGIDVVHADAFGLYSHPRYSVTYPNGDEVQTFTMAFRVREWTGELAVDGTECLDARFFPADRLPQPMYPIHVETIEDFRRWNGEFILK